MAQVVVVLGMDRSGTSLCTSILSLLGIQLGPNLTPPNEYNAAGYFEEWEIYRVNEQALNLLGRNWDTIETLDPLPDGWWQSDEFKPVIGEMVGIARARTETPGKIWGFKDPRTVTLYPLWQETFRICELEPTFVVCLRNPAAVAASLAEREGFEPLYSELLWLEKTLLACSIARGGPHCVVRYEEWFQDPARQWRLLANTLGLQTEAAFCPEAAAMIRRDLRHDECKPLRIQSRMAAEFYKLLGRQELPSQAVLDGFRKTIQAAHEAVSAGEMLWKKTKQQLKEQSAQVEALSAAEQNLTRELAERDASIKDLQNLTRELVAQNAAVAGLQKQLCEQTARVNTLADGISCRDQLVQDLRLHLEREKQETRDLRRDLATRDSDLAARDSTIEEFDKQLSYAQCKAASLASELSARNNILIEVRRRSRELGVRSEQWIQERRGERTWQLMLALRKAHWLLLRQGWRGRAQFVRWALWELPKGTAGLEEHEPQYVDVRDLAPRSYDDWPREGSL